MSKQLADLISAHGYWIVAIIVAVESMGIPAPGETALVTAAIFAGTTHRLDIVWVILAAAVGAIVGDNIGYMLGRRFGYSLLLRYGKLVRIDEKRIKLGQYLFRRHGGKVVFFGRFIALLRAAAAVLAGTNCMDWRRFLFFNASGGVLWAAGIRERRIFLRGAGRATARQDGLRWCGPRRHRLRRWFLVAAPP